jgi:hypothetical protein
VFDKTNDSQMEQLYLYVVDDEEAPRDALQRMVIGDVIPQYPSEQQEIPSPCDTTPPTQEHYQDQDKDQDGREDKDEYDDQVQEESND